MRRLALPELRAGWWALRAGRRVRRRLLTHGLAVGSISRPPSVTDEAGRAVESVLGRFGHTCLERAFVLQAWHAARGIARDVVIGVNSPGGGFRAHAWLEGESGAGDSEYQVLHRRPASPRVGSPLPAQEPEAKPAWVARRKEALGRPLTEWIEEEHRKYGRLPRTLRRIGLPIYKVFVWFFVERRVNTTGRQLEIDHFHPDRVKYEPSGWLFLRRGMRRRDATSGDVFVDFGSGKGRVVYQAARRYPFARVIGVEISERLNEVARANIERNRARLRCSNIEFVSCDAAVYTIPDDMTFAYFYFPFAGETFRTVLGNIVSSIDRNPRRVRLIYACPKLEDVILQTGRFRLVRRSRGGPFDFLPARVSVYEST
jgi:SAM-dependent methyltransferase